MSDWLTDRCARGAERHQVSKENERMACWPGDAVGDFHDELIHMVKEAAKSQALWTPLGRSTEHDLNVGRLEGLLLALSILTGEAMTYEKLCDMLQVIRDD